MYIFLIIIALLIIPVAACAVRGMAAVKRAEEAVLERLRLKHEVREISCGEYSALRVKAMRFHVRGYEVRGLGRFSAMTMNLGLMQMGSFMLVPFEKDVPLWSFEYICVMNKRKLLGEAYSLLLGGTADPCAEAIAACADIPDFAGRPAWYDELVCASFRKQTGARSDSRLCGLISGITKAYIDSADALPELSAEQRTAKAALIKRYSDRLIDEGGMATDGFSKTLGAEKTRDFFDRAFFGTAGH